MLRRVIGYKLTDVLEELIAFISTASLMMEAISISETSVNLHQFTRRNIQEHSHLTYV
jgi:hypothetical protein